MQTATSTTTHVTGDVHCNVPPSDIDCNAATDDVDCNACNGRHRMQRKLRTTLIATLQQPHVSGVAAVFCFRRTWRRGRRGRGAPRRRRPVVRPSPTRPAMHGTAALHRVGRARTIDVHKHARARTRAGALPHLDVTALHEARGRVSVVLEDLRRCIAVKGTENRNKALRVLRIGIGPSE
jgi:hypothetical protein